MATVDSSSTLPQIKAALDDNWSYREDDSLPKALAFITAWGVYQDKNPAEVEHGQERVRNDIESYRWRVKDALRFQAVKSSGGVRILTPQSDFR